MKRTMMALLLSAATLVPAARAQVEQSGRDAAAPSPASPGGTASPLSARDRSFLVDEAEGSAYELALAELARKQAASDDVKRYAAMLVSDHQAYNAALRQLAGAKQVQLPSSMSPDQESSVDEMAHKQGSAFDEAFIKEISRINDQDERDFQEEEAATGDPEVKAFVQRFAAIDRKHAEAARQISRR